MKKLLFMLVCALLPITLWAQENEPYAVLSDNNTVLTFYYDDQKVARNGMGMTLSEGGLPEWAANRRDITSVVFDSSFGEYHGLTNITNWFNCDNLTLMTGMEYWNTDNVTVMYDTFAGCSKLETLDLSHFNTAMVTDMRFLFASCSSLKTIYVGDKWTTGQVQESESMFSGCISLVGGAGTTFDANHTDYTYAHIDGGTANPGYFTAASSSGLQAGMIIIDGQWNGIWEGSLSNGTAVMIDPQEVGKQYTLTYYGSMPTGTSILMVDVNNMVADYPNLSLRLDAIQTDRTTVNFDNAKVRYGDIEDNGKYRMEIYNIYGNTNGNSPIVGSTAASGEAETLLAFNDSISVKFTLMENSPVVNAEPYAVLSDNNTVVTFYYDDQKTARGGVDINNSYLLSGSSSPYGTATTAVIDASFAEYRPTSTAYWFLNCSSLTSITGMENIKTENVTNMASMFEGCSSLTTLDVSGFNTENVMNMHAMFSYCRSLTSLNVSGFNTGKVRDMDSMFSYCINLTSLDVAGFNTQNVWGMSYMFDHCSGLTSLDLTHFNTENVAGMSGMFDSCSSLTSLDVKSFNTQNVTSMVDMFSSCSGLASLDLSGFNTGKVTNMRFMFSGCSGLASLDVSNFNTANVTDMSYMFAHCQNLTEINVSSFNTEKVTNMSGMFWDCRALKSLDLSNFNTANVTDMLNMIRDDYALETVNVSSFNTEKVTDMERMFEGAFLIKTLDLSSFNTANVTNMSYMLESCRELTTVYVGDGWSTTNVTNSTGMFTACSKLVGGAGTTYDADHTDYTYAHIDGGTANPGYFTDKNAPISTLEIYSVEKSATYVANQPINPTQSVIMTPGNDSEWKTDLAIGLTNTVTGESNDPLEFKASIYYPNSTETFSFLDALRGTLNPKDGDLTTNADTGETNNTGSAYIPGHKNLPKSGAYIIYEALQNGSLIIPIRVTADKSLFVVNADGSPVVDMQFKDAAGITQVFKVDPLCSVSSEYISGFISFNVQVGQKYYVFCNASKPRIAGYIFSPESITIDPATMANVKSILNAEPYAALSDNNTVVTFYYDDQKTARGGVDINNSVADSPYRTVTTAVIDASFAEYRPTSKIGRAHV